MRIGVIYVGHQCADLLSASLTPWVEAKGARLGGHDFTIAAVSVPFEGFPQEETRDETRSILDAHAQRGDIDHVIESEVPLKETEARGHALKWLVAQGVDLTIMVDSDERWTTSQIERALVFVAANPWVAWFRVCYQQIVFTPHQWLADPFTPPRIHRVRAGSYVADGFWDDNGVLYCGTITRDFKRDADLSSMTVPQARVWVAHDTWLSDLRSKKKVAYQRLRWGHCSFKWDDGVGLTFDVEFYEKQGLMVPRTECIDDNHGPLSSDRLSS